MNKSLYNHIIILPQSLVDHLDVCFKQVNGDQNTEGWKRNQELRKNKQITYQNLKTLRICSQGRIQDITLYGNNKDFTY
jgi:hypothetical protein